MKDLPNLIESHHAKYQQDKVEKQKVRKFQAKLKDCELNENFIEQVGRLRKEGAVEIISTPSNMPKKGSNYIAIFDHRIIVGKYSKDDTV